MKRKEPENEEEKKSTGMKKKKKKSGELKESTGKTGIASKK
jgi:hypothetical protein